MNLVDKRNNMIDIMLDGQCHITFGSGIPSMEFHKHKDTKLKSKLDKIEAEYSKLQYNSRGLIMDRIIHIQRIERPERHFIFEDADFKVKELIEEGQEDAEDVLNERT